MCCHSQPMEGRHHAPIRLTDYINHLTTIKTIYIRKFSNFNSEWTKTLYQTNLNNIAFLKGYRYDYLSVITSRILATVSFEACSVLDLFFKMFSVHKPLTRYSRQKKTCDTKDYFLWEPEKNKCQISQNDILHMKFSEVYMCFHLIN